MRGLDKILEYQSLSYCAFAELDMKPFAVLNTVSSALLDRVSFPVSDTGPAGLGKTVSYGVWDMVWHVTHLYSDNIH